MAIFQYEAFTASGEKVNGVIEAPNAQAAQKKLRSQSLFVRQLNEDTAKRDRELFPFLSKILYRISRKEIGIFARQMGTLLGAGIAIDDALQSIWEQTENPSLKKVVLQMKEAITEGKTLSQAFGVHKDIFPPVYENMVKVGEATGGYEKTLHRLAELEEKNEELKGKAITALIYPAIMFFLSVFVVFFLLTSVVPQIEMIFASFQGELPLPTRIVLGISNLLQNFWAVGLVLIGLGIYGFIRYRATPVGKQKTDALILRLPFFGSLQKKLQVGRFARNLGTLLESNVSLLGALEIVTGTIGNRVFQDELIKAGKKISEGSTIRDAIRDSQVIPQMARGMIAAGESTDRLPELLIKVAIILESEVDAAVKRMTNALEPIMIVVMGGLVAAIMAAIMMPLYKMTELIK